METKEKPVRFFPRWDKLLAGDRDYNGLIAITIILLIGLILYRMKRVAQKKRTVAEAWEQIRRHCAEQRLTSQETEALIRVLRSTKLDTPEMPIYSRSVFEDYVGVPLTREYGTEMRATIYAKLFNITPREKDEKVFDTRNFKSGQKMHLRFQDISGVVHGVAIRSEPEGLLVALRIAVSERPSLVTNHKVAVVVPFGDGLYFFESRVLDTTAGRVLVCRIAHPEKFTEVRHRNSPRIDVDFKVEITHVIGSDAEGKEASLADLGSSITDTHTGKVKDISLGGCRIEVGTTDHFKKDDVVEFEVQPTPKSKVIECLGHVVNLGTHDGNKEMLHIEFLGVDDSMAKLMELVVERMRRH
ncbi:MAG: PilZ domain-containing protein [Planctomycetes bacterium]|nr:PilZ domain-containing protein [Planctomycetota bacterium]